MYGACLSVCEGGCNYGVSGEWSSGLLYIGLSFSVFLLVCDFCCFVRNNKITLNGLGDHSLIGRLFKCNPSNIYTAFRKILTDTARCDVPLRQLNFLLFSSFCNFFPVCCSFACQRMPNISYRIVDS